MKHENIFHYDYARMLAERICWINRDYIDQMERQAKRDDVPRGKLSTEMVRIEGRWGDDIRQACIEMMDHMNRVVNHLQDMTTEIMNSRPQPPILPKVEE